MAIDTLFDLEEYEADTKQETSAPAATLMERAGLESWRGFEVKDERGDPVTDDAIKAAFKDLYDCQPFEIRRWPAIIWAGPVPRKSGG